MKYLKLTFKLLFTALAALVLTSCDNRTPEQVQRDWAKRLHVSPGDVWVNVNEEPVTGTGASANASLLSSSTATVRVYAEIISFEDDIVTYRVVKSDATIRTNSQNYRLFYETHNKLGPQY